MRRRELLQASLGAAPLAAAGALATGCAEPPRRVLRPRAAPPPPAPSGPPWPESPFLRGNFAPVRDEVKAERLPIVGALPPELRGTFVRNGPNPARPPLGGYHWFLGDGMVHGVRLDEGGASYQNRYVRTASWLAEERAGRAVYPGVFAPPGAFGEPPAGAPRRKNAANTSVVVHHGKLFALYEGGEPHAIGPRDLSTRGAYDFGGRLRHPFTAHPKIDPATGELFAFGYRFSREPYLSYSVFDREGRLTHSTDLALPRPVMMHDFALTESHVIFMDWPYAFDLARARAGQNPLAFDPRLGARLGVLPRGGEGSAVRWFDVAPGFVFHVLGAFERDNVVTLVACRYDRYPGAGEGASGTAGEAAPALHEWSLDLGTGRARERRLGEAPVEFPRMNDGYAGRPFRYGYFADVADDDKVHKVDLSRGAFETRSYGRGRSGGEPVFVPRPGARGEDEGWLLNFVYDANERRSELVVTDARSFDARPVARVLLPVRVPYGLHGAWVPSDVA